MSVAAAGGIQDDTARRFRFLPEGTSSDAAILIAARGIRAFGDGFISILLPVHIVSLGFSATRIGILTTVTLLGSAVLTLAVGQFAHRWKRIDLLLRTAMLMIATGVGFFLLDGFWPLLLVAFVGTINPSTGDVSIFLPTEQSLLPQTTSDRNRTAIFARYSLAGAIGALAAGIPTAFAHLMGVSTESTVTAMFLLYGALGIVITALYRRLTTRIEPAVKPDSPALGPSKRAVYRLAALFSLDSFAGGFSLQSVIALWLFMRFDLSTAVAGTIFFWAGLLSAFSQLLAPRVAARIGLVNTMVFSHLPANIFLILTPLMPTLPLAILFLLMRSALAQMDVPARTSYVMAVVTPEERPAAASITNVPRSLATAISPTIAGSLLQTTAFGWPLVIAGSLKATYDLLLLAMFRHERPPEERKAHEGHAGD
ncbi:MAG: MFS transporter [Thermomicrobiales bacterium]